MQYKVVPFAAAVASNQSASAVAGQVESIITSNAADGWEYVGTNQLQTFKAGSAGCFGFGATPSIVTTTEFIVFRK